MQVSSLQLLRRFIPLSLPPMLAASLSLEDILHPTLTSKREGGVAGAAGGVQWASGGEVQVSILRAGCCSTTCLPPTAAVTDQPPPAHPPPPCS